MKNMDNDGRSLRDGLSPSAEPLRVSSADAASIPNAGQWVVFRDSSYDPYRAGIRQIEKATPKQIRLHGSQFPRVITPLHVFAAVDDLATAERIRDGIGGIGGEYDRRRSAAEEERRRRVAEAAAAADEQIRRLVAKSRGES